MQLRILPVLLALTSAAVAQPLLVESSDGRTISIEVTSIDGDKVTFTKQGDARSYTLPLDRFSATSQNAIKEAAKAPAAVATGNYPKLDIDLVIGKRGTKENWYMKSQTVTSKVKLANTSSTIACPKSKAYIFFVGQDREHASRLMVLAAESFEFQMPRGGNYEFECGAFTTRYDSDNKGDGNIGGYQYKHYVLVLLDDAGNVVGCKSSSNDYQKLVEQDHTLAKKVTKFKKDTFITERLESLTNQNGHK